MHQAIRDKNVSLNVTYDGKTGQLIPRWVLWRGKAYKVREVGKIYTERSGIAKIYYYSLNVGSLDMLIRVCHSPFSIVLEEISDGLAD